MNEDQKEATRAGRPFCFLRRPRASKDHDVLNGYASEMRIVCPTDWHGFATTEIGGLSFGGCAT
ncbi:MAG: hypothetical protein IT449_19305 [Phycisphaerales bacterium]|nr:hypothetical protein [Phycisphaerales bacterium]